MNLIEDRFVHKVEKEGTWTFDVESRHFTANPVFYELLDFTPKKLNPLPKNWEQFLHPEECQAVKQQIVAQLKTNQPNFKVICRLNSAKQTWIWVLIRVQITKRDKHGQPQHLQGIVLDFTDIKLSEQLFQVQKQLIEKMIATTDKSLIGQIYLNSVFQIQELQAASIFTCDQHANIELLVQQGFSIKTIDTLKQLKPLSPEIKQMRVHQPIIISSTHNHTKFMKMLKLDCCQNGR